ncbi:MAG: acyl-CoA dehydrogenase family protein, partial [Casimicrobiaceae bacterium]
MIYETPEHTLLRDQVGRFLTTEVEPHATLWEEAGATPREVLRRMGTIGLLGLMVDERHGGAGADALTNLVFAEALSQSTFGGFIITVLVHTDMASPHLADAGTPEQQARWLPGVCSGKAITAVAVTEPGAGSDVAGLRTRARRDGDHWVIDGTKMFITNGVHADVVIVAARTDSAAKGSRGISLFLVERGTPGFTVGRALDKTGWRSSDTAELIFEDCRVPASALLGKENEGFYAIMRNFQRERLALAAMAVGHATVALRLALEHVRTRQAFGGTLWQRETIRQRLAMLDARTQAARAYMYHCAWLMTA